MKKCTLYLIFLLIFINLSKYAFCQQNIGDAGQAGEFLRYGVGGRALAMGGAFGALANDASAAYWNPAGISQLEKYEICFMSNRIRFDSYFSYASFIFPHDIDSLNTIAFGLSWICFNTSEYVERDEYTKYYGKFGDSQNSYLFSLSYQNENNSSFINLGVNLNIISYSITNLKNYSYDTKIKPKLGFDVGLLFDPKQLNLILFKIPTQYVTPLRFGLVFQNINNPNLFPSLKHNEIPFSFRWSIAYVLKNVFKTPLSSNIVIDGLKLNDTERKFSCYLGSEISYVQKDSVFQASFRIGSRSQLNFRKLTLGIGMEINPDFICKNIPSNFRLSFDYYYRADEAIFFNEKEIGYSISIKF